MNKNFNFNIPPPPKAKITLEKVYKYNRIYNDKSGSIRIQVYEKDSKYYLVCKGRITTYTDYNECFEEVKKLSEKSK